MYAIYGGAASASFLPIPVLEFEDETACFDQAFTPKLHVRYLLRDWIIRNACNMRSEVLRYAYGALLPIPVKAWLWFREFVAISGNPDVESGQEENAHDQVGDESADDDDGKRTLGVRTDGVRKCGGQ